jgi:hypothetical protein
MIRILLLLTLFGAGFFVVGVFNNSGYSVSDFERVQISNYRSYLNLRRTKVIIEASGKEYVLFSNRELMPKGMRFVEIPSTLNRSTEAVLWVEESQGYHAVIGLEVDGRLIISPAQGVKFHEDERKAGLWGAVGCFAMAIFGYFYFKNIMGLIGS